LQVSVTAEGRTGTADLEVDLHHVPEVVAQPTWPADIVAGYEVALPGYVVKDKDGDTLTVTLTPQGMALSVQTVPNVAVSYLDDGSLVLNGVADDVNTALSSLSFKADAGELGLAIHVTDGDPLTIPPEGEDQPLALAGAPIADPAPTELLAPSLLAATVGQEQLISGIRVSDADSAQVKVTLTTQDGSLNLVPPTGAKVDVRSVDDGLQVSGSVADVNAALQTLKFKGATTGPATIDVLADDENGTSLVGETVIKVDVGSRKAPEAGGDKDFTSLTNGLKVTEDTSGTFQLPVTTLLADGNSVPTQVRILSVTGGTVTDAGGNPIVLGANGTLVNLVAGNIPLRLSPELNRNEPIKISYAVVDTENTGLNSQPSTFTLPITAVNDAPVLQPSGLNYSYAENASGVALLAGVTVADVDSTQEQSQARDAKTHLLAMPLLGYGFAWVGHFFFEKNRPATFKYPLWSLMGDFRLFFETATGKRRF
jgi:hypothetical protein